MFDDLTLNGQCILQHRMLRISEAGLVDHWYEMYLPKPVQCMVDPSSRQAKMANIKNPALVNLHGLAPAFLFLLFGFILASVAIFIEWIQMLQPWKSIPLPGSHLRIEEK